jgi:hypothetical protein
MVGDLNRTEENTHVAANSYVVGGRLRDGVNVGNYTYQAGTIFMINGMAIDVPPGHRLVRTRSQQTRLVDVSPACEYVIHTFVLREGMDGYTSIIKPYGDNGRGYPLFVIEANLGEGNAVHHIAADADPTIIDVAEIARVETDESAAWCTVYVGVYAPVPTPWPSIVAARYSMSAYVQLERL